MFGQQRSPRAEEAISPANSVVGGPLVRVDRIVDTLVRAFLVVLHEEGIIYISELQLDE